MRFFILFAQTYICLKNETKSNFKQINLIRKIN